VTRINLIVQFNQDEYFAKQDPLITNIVSSKAYHSILRIDTSHVYTTLKPHSRWTFRIILSTE